MDKIEFKKNNNDILKILVIGIGNIGLRHIQGLCKSNYESIEFFTLDLSNVYLKRYKEEFLEIKNKFTVTHLDHIDNIQNYNIDLTILSMTANNRVMTLMDVLKKIRTEFVLLEKPITQSLEELKELKKLKNKNIFVNFPRRYCKWHVAISNKIKSKIRNSAIHVKVVGKNIGIACNISHYIDLVFNWTNSYPIAIDVSGLDKWKKSKRKDFYDIDGKIKIFFENKSVLDIDSSLDSQENYIEIADNKNNFISQINYKENKTSFFDGEIITGSLKYQSESTHEILDLLNSQILCSLSQAIKCHEPVIKELIKHWNRTFNTELTKIMIT